jgi:dienelactone hydrolase
MAHGSGALRAAAGFLRIRWRMTVIVLLLAAAALAGGLFGLRLWLRGNLDRRLAAAEEAFEALTAPTRPALATGVGETVAVQLGYVRWLLEPGRDDSWFRPWSSSRRQMGETERALAALRADPSADPYARATGAILRGYRSPVDSDLTSYSLRVPEDRDPAAAEPMPLVVHLHGHMGVRPFQGHPAPDYGDGVLVLSPHGKGAVDYMGPAEADALAAIDDACGRCRVSGVYLTGGSMGGTGAWQLAAHYPWRFTAIAPVAANADPRVWWRLWDARPPAEPPAGSLAEALEKLKLLDSPVTFAANLREVPALVYHGDADEIVPVEHARSMVAALRAAGCPVEYHEVPGGEHKLAGNADFKAIVQWLVAHPPKEKGLRPPPPEVAERFAAERLLPGAAPTFSDLFNARFAVVYGTASADERTNAMLRRQAEDFARNWEWRFASRPPVFSDAEFPAEGDARCRDAGLLLYGGPDENRVARRLLALAKPAPPMRFEPGRCILDTSAGPVVAEGPTAGARFCWPNPLAPKRMIGVVWGASWRGLVDSNARFGAGFDWTVHQHRHWFGFALFDERTAGPDSFLAVGFWSRDWQLDGKFLWRRDAAAAPAPGGAPRHWSADEAPAGQALALDALAPVEIEQVCGPIGFGRGWSGAELSAGSPARRLSSGLGVRGRSRVAYDLGGRWSRLAVTVGADLAGRTPESLTVPRVEHGKMVFIVQGDGKELARSGDLGLADPAQDLSVDVRGVARLELLVVPAGRYEWHLGPGAWGNAELVP